MFSYETSHNTVFQKHELDYMILRFPHLRHSPRYWKGWHESWKDARWNQKKPNFWKITNLQLLMTTMKSVMVKLYLLSILSLLVFPCRLVIQCILVMLCMLVMFSILVMLSMLVMLCRFVMHSISVMLSMLVMLCRFVMLSMLVMILLMILLMTKGWKQKRNINIYLISLKSLLSSLKTIPCTFSIWIWGN